MNWHQEKLQCRDIKNSVEHPKVGLNPIYHILVFILVLLLLFGVFS